MHGESPEVMFELRHEPGLMGLSDFTELTAVTITIGGEPFGCNRSSAIVDQVVETSDRQGFEGD